MTDVNSFCAPNSYIYPEVDAYFPASGLRVWLCLMLCVAPARDEKKTTHLSQAWTLEPSFPLLFLQVSLLLLCEGHATTQEGREKDVETGTLRPSYR